MDLLTGDFIDFPEASTGHGPPPDPENYSEAAVARCVDALRQAQDVQQAKRTLMHPQSAICLVAPEEAIAHFEAEMLANEFRGARRVPPPKTRRRGA